jgi:hypothetical protein
LPLEPTVHAALPGFAAATTYSFAQAPLALADTQIPIVLADLYWDQQNILQSSLRYPGDVVLRKPNTDVYVTGTARLTSGQTQTAWIAGVQVRNGKGILLQKNLRLTGPRQWEHRTLSGWTLTEPQTTNSVALRYENAFGGSHEKQINTPPDTQSPELVQHAANPAGVGFFDKLQLDKRQRYAAPQIEVPENPVQSINQKYLLAGFGPTARFWPCRSQYAGTYDAAWQQQFAQSIIPDYPPDFDEAFFQAAHPDLVCKGYLRGDEIIGLAGLSPQSHVLYLGLPGIGLVGSASDSNGREHVLPFVLDTVHVDLDTTQLTLTWRLTLARSQDIESLQIYSAAFNDLPTLSS